MGDRFCLDGNRLRTTNGSVYGTAGATYQTEIADFSLITSNGSAGSGPAWFKVQAKNGLTYEYGNTADSAILASGTSSVRTWALNAVRDRNGNAMTFTYMNDTSNGSYRPASIQYTYTGSSSSNNGYSVVFTYQSRSSADQLWQYAIGGVNNQLNYLSAVTVNTVSGSTVTMVHGYELTYVTAPTTSRLRLATIQECASSTSDCFPASSVGYQDGATGWGSETAANGNATNLAFALPVDVNGDGIDDLVYPDPTSGDWYYELGTSSGVYAGPYDTGLASTNYQSALAIDFYANGRKEILVPNASGYWRVLQFVSAGAAFSYTDTTTSAAGVVPGSASVGDVDGDGREDLIYAVSGGSSYAAPDTVYYRLNTGGAFSASAGTLINFPNGSTCGLCVKFGNSEPFGNPGYRFASQIRKLDFNGDGRADFLVYLGTCYPDQPRQCGTTYPITYSWTILLSQPNGTYVAADAVNYSVGTTPNEPPLVGDFDGDGCTDIAYTHTAGALYFALGTCGRSGVTNVLASPIATGVAVTGTPVLAMDWDGDGRTDIVMSNAASHWVVARSVGNNLSAVVDTGLTNGGATVAQVADSNGDGEADLLYTASSALKTRLHAGVQPDLATSFTDAYGVSYSPSYVALSQAPSNVFVQGTGATYPTVDYDGPWVVVSSYTASDGIGGTYTVGNFYTTAVTDLQGRGFQGFGATRTWDSRNGLYRYIHYFTAFPSTGMILSDGTTQPTTSKQITGISNHLATLTLDSTANNQRYFPYFDYAYTNMYEVGGTEDAQLITTLYTYHGPPDNYGNFTDVKSILTDNDPSSPYYNSVWTSTTATTVTPDTSSNWCLSLPTEVDVTNTAPGVPSITRHVSFTPDYGECRQTVQLVEPSSSLYKVTTAYGFDSFGNLSSQTVTGVGMAARITSIDWGTSGQFPSLVTNALGQQTHLAYNTSYGLPSSLTDPNGISTSWQYDTFGRKIKELRPDGTSTTWAYNSCVTGGCLNSLNKMTVVQTAVNTDSSTFSIQNTYLDLFDRTMVTSKLMANGNFDSNEVDYDNLGHVHLQVAPCVFHACVRYVTTNTYDMVGRLVQSQRPISASNSTLQTTTYGYQGRTSTVTDAQGKVTTTINQVTGSPGRAQDANGYYVNFNHDAFGAILSVTDSLSNTLKTTTYGYGLKAFPVSSTDMDLGARTYTVDALGELTGYVDAKSQTFSMAYDALSRPTTRAEPDLTTTWTWGASASSYNIGKLASVSSSSSAGTYSDAYIYNNLGQLGQRTITLPTAGAMTYNYYFSTTTGKLLNLKYPSIYTPSLYRLTVNYVYTNGVLTALRDQLVPSTTFWQANTYNARGQVTEEITTDLSGDPAIVTQHNYDAVTGWVNSIQTGVGSGAALQNEAYSYDLLGNVTQRQNNNLGLTENFYYDNVYRLDHSTLGGTPNLQMTYDGGSPGPGNITARSDVASNTAWTYDPVKKHAVTKAGTGAGSYTYTYDANGNVSSRNGTLFTWTSYNYPNYVGTSTESASFDYGADRQRWRMIYNGPSGIETTYYATPLFEQVVTSSGTDYRHYVYAGNKPVLVISHTSAGAVNVRSLLADHQGSVASIVANATGTSVVSESFTAFGNRREASTWTGSPTSGELTSMNGVTREGYTFQTVLGSMGLNHMNGRVQDAITGRFLSPDPNIGNQANTQSFNRYSYVGNNPLSLTDPSGFRACNGAKRDAPGCAMGEQNNHHRLDIGEGSLGNSISGVDGGDSSGDSDYESINDAINATSDAIYDAIGTALDSGDASTSTTTSDGGGSVASAAQSGGGAQSQSSGQSQSAGGGSTVWNDPNDATAGVTAYGTRSTGNSGNYSYVDNYVNFVSTYAINVGPYAVALAGGLWPKSWAPATGFRPPLLGSTNPLTSVPRAFGVPGADSVFVQTGAAGIGLLTVGIGFYDIGIETEGLFYALPDVSVPPPSFPIFPY
jgi:RHS repeat-associated protein